jgi:hypothetical protein
MAIVKYPAPVWLEKAVGQGNLTPEMRTVIAGLKNKLLPNAGKQNPNSMDYLNGMIADLYSRSYAATQDDKKAKVMRDTLMDAMFGGINNFNWRGATLLDPSSSDYTVWKKRFDQVWGRIAATPVTSDAFATLDRSQFSFGQTNADISAAILNGIRTYVDANATNTEKATAQGRLDNMLDDWGLSSLKPSLDDAVWKKGLTNSQEILKQIKATDAYKTRFAGMIQHNKTQPTKIASEGDYLRTEAAMLQLGETYLPAGVLNQQKIAQLIGRGVGVSELDSRVTQGYMAALNADPATRRALADQGVDLTHLAYYFLDPDNGEKMLTQQVTRASLQGYATDVGLKGFTNDMAQSIADQARAASTGASGQNPYGTYTVANARNAMDFAAQNEVLTAAPVGTSQRSVSTEQLIGSKIPGFMGSTQADAEQQVKLAQESKTAPFNKGGGYVTDQKGVTGIGSAPE